MCMEDICHLVADKIGTKLIGSDWHLDWLVVLRGHVDVAHKNADGVAHTGKLGDAILRHCSWTAEIFLALFGQYL